MMERCNMVDDAVVETAARALCCFFNLNPDLPITFEDRPGLTSW